MYKHVTRLLAIVLFVGVMVVTGSLIFTREAVGAGPYVAPQLSLLNATIPANLLADQTQIKCLVRTSQSGAQISVRAGCYQAEDPDPMPPPPYQVGFEHLVVNTTLNQSTGQMTIPYFPCQEIIPGLLAGGTDLNIQLSKGGGTATGTVVSVLDSTSPFDCSDGSQILGTLSAVPLTISHDEDGDGCTDYNELGFAIPNLDPFNPNDCSVLPPPTPCGGCAVGGEARVPPVDKSFLQATESSSPNAFIRIGVASGAVVIVIAALAVWNSSRREVRHE